MTKQTYLEAIREQLAQEDGSTPYSIGRRQGLQYAIDAAESLRATRAPKQRLVSLDKDECALVYFLLGYAEQTENVRRIREKLSKYKEL